MKIFFLIVFSLSSMSLFAKSLEELHDQLYGCDHLHPDEGSILGQFIKETNAKTVIRTFPNSPEGSTNPVHAQGVEKLVIAVSPETFAKFKEYFSSRNYLFIETLLYDSHINPAFEGKRGQFAPPLVDNTRFTREGTLMIPILLSDEEGDRLANYFQLTNQTRWTNYRNVWMYPWNLQTADGNRYSSETGARGCAAWFGNVPIGSKMVDTYFVPNEDGSKFYQQKLLDYVMPRELSEAEQEGLRSLWKVPGYQQMGEMLNPDANRRGDFSNGGWIAYALLGSVGANRTPIVFLQTNDETQEIPENFNLNIRAH